jgi:hypothetical protein
MRFNNEEKKHTKNQNQTKTKRNTIVNNKTNEKDHERKIKNLTHRTVI